MTKLTPSNISSIAAIPNGSIIKKVDDDNFAEATTNDLGNIVIEGTQNILSSSIVANSGITIDTSASMLASQNTIGNLTLSCTAYPDQTAKLQKSIDNVTFSDVYSITNVTPASTPIGYNSIFVMEGGYYYRTQCLIPAGAFSIFHGCSATITFNT